MLPAKKDQPRQQEKAGPIWHVPETVPSWHVPEPRVRSWHVPEPSTKSWHIPVPAEPGEKERENRSPDVGRQSQWPTDSSTPNQPSSQGVKTKASMKEIPTRQLVGSQDGHDDQPDDEITSGPACRSPPATSGPACRSPPAGESSTSSSGERKRPMPTIPGELLRNHPSVTRKRPIPTIPPGGTLLETSPIHKSVPSGVQEGEPSATSAANSVKTGTSSQQKTSVIAPSTTSTPKERPDQLGAHSPRGGTCLDDASMDRPILTGESVGESSSLEVPKKSKKSGQSKLSPVKMTARKSTKSVQPSRTEPQQRTPVDHSSASSKRERFILTIPPEFHFKGEPPRWIRALYLEPLLDGWKREIVERATATKKTSDVYYYSPEGRKFRSRVEIGQYLLDEGITKYSAAFNFWFKGVALGDEFEPYEIIRASGKTGSDLARKISSKKSKPPKQKKSSTHLLQLASPEPDNLPEDYSEEGMIFDEEIEVVGTGDGQDAVFDPAVLSLRNQPVRMNMPEVKERPERTIPPPKKRKQPNTSNKEGSSNQPSDSKLFCICDDVEHGDMVLCDNVACEIGWYHFDCVSITSAPAGSWYCPICRGASSDVMSSSIALVK